MNTDSISSLTNTLRTRFEALATAIAVEEGDRCNIVSLATPLMDVWEKSHFVVQLIDTLVGFATTDRLPSGPAPEVLYDLEGNEQIAAAHLFLGLSLALHFLPNSQDDQIGLFGDLIALESSCFGQNEHEDALASSWTDDAYMQHRIAQSYTPANDPLTANMKDPLPTSRPYADALFAALERNYIRNEDLDEEYTLYMQQFCRLTLDFSAHCLGFSRTMARFVATDYDATEQDLGDVAALIVHGRSIATFGFRFNYAVWVNHLDNRL